MDLNVKHHLSQLISIRKRKRTNIFGELISLQLTQWVFDNAKLPTSSLLTESGSGNCQVILYRLWPENICLGNFARADSNHLAGGAGVVHDGYHLSFWRFSLFFTVSLASKLAIFPSKRCVLGAWKGPKRTNGGFGASRPQNHLKCFKTRENITTPQLASLHGLASNRAKNCYKIGERRPNGTYFAHPRWWFMGTWRSQLLQHPPGFLLMMYDCERSKKHFDLHFTGRQDPKQHAHVDPRKRTI